MDNNIHNSFLSCLMKGETKMVYLTGKNMGTQIPRIEKELKLIGIKSGGDEVINAEKGLFKSLDFSLVDEEGIWTNIRFFASKNDKQETIPIDLNSQEMKIVKQCDNFLKEKRKPVVKVTFYTKKVVGMNKNHEEVIFVNNKGSIYDLMKLKVISVGEAQKPKEDEIHLEPIEEETI